MQTDVTEIVGDVNTALTRLPTSGRAVSDSVFDSTIAGRIDANVSTRSRVKTQTGWADNPTLSAGTGEDAKYTDITITAVSAVNRCEVTFVGGATTSLGSFTSAMSQSGTNQSWMVTPRLINTTTLRLSCVATGVLSIYGRWTVRDNAATS